MHTTEVIWCDNGLTDHQRDVLLGLLLEQAGIIFIKQSGRDEYGRPFTEYSLLEAEHANET